MRRTFLGCADVGIRARYFPALAQPGHLRLQAVKLTGHFQHGLVLFGHMALQPRETFLQPVNAFVRHDV